jgi:hypothetical protein
MVKTRSTQGNGGDTTESEINIDYSQDFIVLYFYVGGGRAGGKGVCGRPTTFTTADTVDGFKSMIPVSALIPIFTP